MSLSIIYATQKITVPFLMDFRAVMAMFFEITLFFDSPCRYTIYLYLEVTARVSCVRMVTWSAATASSCKLWDEPVSTLPWFWFHLCSSGVSSVSGTPDGKKYPGWEYICHPIFSKLCSAWGGETWTGKVPNNHQFTICYLSIGKIFSSLGWFSKLIIRNRNQIFMKPW